jgi:dolichol-phosphate mannosyltransferase
MVILTLPAYNEEKALPALLAAFAQTMESAGCDYRVVVVDDGSNDDTCEVIRAASLTIPIQSIRHQVNRGLGETMRDALRAAVQTSAGGDIVVTMDSDNTHDPDTIPVLLHLLRAGNQVAIASRYRKGSRVVGLSMPRRLMSYAARLLFQVVCPIRGVRDYTCGFRAYEARALQRAFAVYGDSFVTERSFACMAEILFKLARTGATIAEAPMVLRYDRKMGSSKMSMFQTVLGTLQLVARLRAS